MSKRILLLENEVISNEIIANGKQNYQNGRTLITMLDKLGLTVSKVENWQQIEQHFMTDYPKASLLFNLQANNIESEYKEAEAFYLKHRLSIIFEQITESEIENIKEKQRLYADRPNQIEAIELLNTVNKNLTRLIELGVRIDVNAVHLVSPILAGDMRTKPPLKINQRYLVGAIRDLKQ